MWESIPVILGSICVRIGCLTAVYGMCLRWPVSFSRPPKKPNLNMQNDNLAARGTYVRLAYIYIYIQLHILGHCQSKRTSFRCRCGTKKCNSNDACRQGKIIDLLRSTLGEIGSISFYHRKSIPPPAKQLSFFFGSYFFSASFMPRFRVVTANNEKLVSIQLLGEDQ